MSPVRSTEVSRVGPLLGLAATVLILYVARGLLIPFAFALMLAFLLAPAVVRLEARRVPRVGAVAITGFFAFTLICGVGYVVVGQLLNVAGELPAYRLNVQKKIAAIHLPAAQLLQNAFAGFVERMRFAGEHELHRTIRIVDHGGQPLNIPQDQIRPLVGREAAREADR